MRRSLLCCVGVSRPCLHHVLRPTQRCTRQAPHHHTATAWFHFHQEERTQTKYWVKFWGCIHGNWNVRAPPSSAANEISKDSCTETKHRTANVEGPTWQSYQCANDAIVVHPVPSMINTDWVCAWLPSVYPRSYKVSQAQSARRGRRARSPRRSDRRRAGVKYGWRDE